MEAIWKNLRQNISLYLLLMLTILIFLPMNILMVTSHGHNDFRQHIGFARELSQGNPMPEFILAHPVWQVSIYGLHEISGISLENAAVIVQMMFHCFLAAVLYWLFYKNLTAQRKYLLVVLPLALMLVNQIMLFVFGDGLYYLGYIGMNTYHNPTISALKPFALILIIFNVDLIQGKRFHWTKILLSAFIVIVSTLVKPNLIICLLPAVGLFALSRLASKRNLDWNYLIFGLSLPSVIVLLWQFFVTYGVEDAGILIAPFAVMRTFSDHLIPKFILSIWFPVLVVITYYKQARTDDAMQLNGLIFMFGVIFTYFFAESGNRFPHANFGWSGEIALFSLFVFSLIFFFKQKTDSPSARWRWVLYIGFLPHVAAGIVYYIYTFTQNTFV